MDLVSPGRLGRRADQALLWGSFGFLLPPEHQSRSPGPSALVSDAPRWLEPGENRGGALRDLGGGCRSQGHTRSL